MRAARDPLLRIFRDDFGREWEVRVIADAETATAASSNPALMLGALLFDSGEAQRRLEPLPAGWYIASEALLTQWCETARPLGSSPAHPFLSQNGGGSMPSDRRYT